MYIKKLVGKKCYLSPIDINDAEQYTVWVNDQEMADFLTFASANISVETEKSILAELMKGHNYGIIDAATNRLIGNIGFPKIDQINCHAEIGIFIGNKEYWSHGYGMEALFLLIDYAYKKLNLHNIMLKVLDYNTRAIKCYEKVGFKKIGEIREALIRNGKKHNVILMDITPEDFYACRFILAGYIT